MYLVLDNAAYHKPRDETWIENSKARNKYDLAHQLMDLGMTEVITASGNVVQSHRFESKVSEGGPLKDDLIRATTMSIPIIIVQSSSSCSTIRVTLSSTLLPSAPKCNRSNYSGRK